jgi:FixJ family two-component response regulator
MPMKGRPTPEQVVFVIDDDASVRDSLKNLLESVGLHAELFDSAQAFMSYRPPEVPSCLILDVRLPGLSGLEFQNELSKRGVSLPIIFITGHGDIPMSVRAMKLGAVEFLTKPFRDRCRLARALRAVDGARKRSDRVRRCRSRQQANCRQDGHQQRHGQSASRQYHAQDAGALSRRVAEDGGRARRRLGKFAAGLDGMKRSRSVSQTQCLTPPQSNPLTASGPHIDSHNPAGPLSETDVRWVIGWLGDLDSNQDWRSQSPLSYR